MKFAENISLAKYTTFKIGGPAKHFYIAKNKKDLIEAINKAKESKLSIFILGGGSNTLALGKGYDGLVVKIHNSQFTIHNSEIRVDAGVDLSELVKIVSKKSLAGLEWAAGIPGTVGGAVYGNAQAFDSKMSDIIKNVEVLNLKNLSVKTLNRKQCSFSAKKSIFKQNKNLVILSVILKLKKGDRGKIEEEAKEHIKLRKEKHPLQYSSAGSIFVNRVGKPSSSYLIEKAGLKGTKVGGAEVSSKHAGFIINTGHAKAKDVLDLIKIIKQKVKDKFAVDLQEEIQIIK